MEQFLIRTKMAGVGLLKIIEQYTTWMISIAIFAIFMPILVLTSFGSTYWGLLTSSNLSFQEKIRTFFSMYTAGFSDWAIMLMCIMQALTLAVLIKTMLRQSKFAPGETGGSLVVSILAGLGLGCPTCGTSILLPFASLFVTTSTSAFAQALSQAIMVVIVVADLFIIRRLSYVYSQLLETTD
ncbi:MAG: hypothetical protein LBC43_04585 [Bifidobacteriaceae bacterium]|nr:hypothetical protein [Bifidobacteriaceae bacterium]